MTFKEHEMICNNSNTQSPPVSFAPWLVLYGSQTPQSESVGRLISSSVERHASEEFLPLYKKVTQADEESTETPDTTQFAIFSDVRVERLADELSHSQLDDHNAEPNMVLSETFLVRSKNRKIRVNLNALCTSSSLSIRTSGGEQPVFRSFSKQYMQANGAVDKNLFVLTASTCLRWHIHLQGCYLMAIRESKCSIDWQKPQLTMSALPEYGSNLHCEFGRPMMYSKYLNADQSFGLFPLYGAQCQGRIMLPLNLTAEDGPRYVNAKQYQRILTRLKCRAKAKSENFGRARKPYMHKSRHLHAMRRPRGCGGRFLNTKALKNETAVNMKKTCSDGMSPCPIGPQSSEVLQSESRDLNALKGGNNNRTNLTGLEMASLYSPHRLLTNHVRPCVHPHLRVDNVGHDIVMPGKWVPAADSCCNLKVV